MNTDVVVDMLRPTQVSASKQYALVYWTQERKTSVIPVTNIPEEDRQVGKETIARWGDSKKGRSYPARILEISSEYLKFVKQV